MCLPSPQVGELDGIPLILDSCSLDDSNPCILECAPQAATPALPLAPVPCGWPALWPACPREREPCSGCGWTTAVWPL